MPIEIRTRITLFLPAPRPPQAILRADKLIHQMATTFGNVRVSGLDSTVFAEYFEDAVSSVVCREENLLIISDAQLPPDDRSLLGYLDALKLACQRDFNDEPVWLTLTEIQRVTTYDP